MRGLFYVKMLSDVWCGSWSICDCIRIRTSNHLWAGRQPYMIRSQINVPLGMNRIGRHSHMSITFHESQW